MRYPVHVILSSLLLCARALPLPAQLFHLPYRHYTVHDGLAQQQVVSLIQDRRGYLWIGTKAGVSRFNGERFENFRTTQGAPGDHVTLLEEDAQGNIWAFTPAGAGYYDGVRWHKLLDHPADNMVIVGPGPETLLFDNSEHTLWRASGDTLVLAGRLDTLPSPSRPNRGVPGRWTDYYSGADSLIMVNITAEGEIAGVLHLAFAHTFTSGHPVYGQRYWLTQPDGNGLMHVGRLGERAPFDSIRCDGLTGLRPVVDLLRCKNGDIYFVGINKVLYVKPAGETRATALDIPVHNPNRLLEGREGAIWIGSEDGLYQYFPGGFRYISSTDVPAPWSIVEDDAGDIWFGSFEYGLRRLHENRLYRIAGPPHEDSPDCFYYGASKDDRGNLYFPHSHGLYRFRQGQYENVFSQNRFFPTANQAVLYSWFDTTDRKIIAGIQGGVLVYDPGTGAKTPVRLEAAGDKFILGITRDSRANYWFVTGSRGIFRYHIPGGPITHFQKEMPGVPLEGAICVENDGDAGVWLGGRDGLFFFSHETQSFKKVGAFTITHPVNNLKIADSLLLIGSTGGLHVLHLPDFHRGGRERIKTYNRNNGLIGIEPDQNGAFLDAKGNYWVICFNQIATIPKQRINLDDYPSRIRIFQINDQRVPYSGSTPIVLPPGENQITIRFESIGFQRPLRTQYSWRLQGYNDHWSEWTEDQIAFFPQLPSGEYAFEVRSRHPGSADATSSIPDSYRFRVELPFYREPFFYQYALIGGLLAVMLSAIGVWLYWSARREARKARAAAAEREQMMKYYQIQTLQSQLQPHFIFNLLNAIKSYIVRGRQDEAEEQVERLAKVMRRFLESSVGADLENLTQHNQEITLQSEIELLQYYIELMQVLKPGKFTFDLDVEPGLHPGNIVVAPMIIQPFVENAIKHGLVPKKDGPGHLNLRFFKCPEGICCTVQDDGPGLKPPGPDNGGKKPMGIELVMNRVKLLRNFGVQIDIQFESPVQGGACVYIRFSE